LKQNLMVLSLGPALARGNPGVARIEPGATIKISTATVPDLKGVKTAISGGNVLVHDGKKQKIEVPETGAYKYRSMTERHPRTAIGANDTHFFLVQVDGRQPRLSVGMTLAELGAYMAKLGCTLAMSLDGGASSTFWMEGKVMNSPCHGRERDIANGLVLLQKKAPQNQSSVNRSQSGG
jgi:exopolysaccharide biosynthesis protein